MKKSSGSHSIDEDLLQEERRRAMSLYFTDEDVANLIKEVPVLEIVDYLGIEKKRFGSTVSILCPSPDHNDRHFGSCKQRGNHFICFACGKKISSLDILLWEGQMSYYEAACTLAKIAGRESDFQASRKDTFSKKKKEITRLTYEEKILLGFQFLHNRAEIINISPQKPEGKRFIRDEGGDYLILKDCVEDPWKALARDDPDAFSWMVLNKCREQMIKIYLLADEIKKDSKGKWGQIFSFPNCNCHDICHGIVLALGHIYNDVMKIYIRFGGTEDNISEMIHQNTEVYQEFACLLSKNTA